MFSPTFSENPKHAWGTAASPSPAAALGGHRTPRDDAPVYDPLLWKDTDNAYISTLAAHLMTHQTPAPPSFSPVKSSQATKPSLNKFLSSSWNASPAEDAAERLSKFHAVYSRRPTTMIGRLLQYVSCRLFPRWHEDIRLGDVMALSTRELIDLMQLALAAGEMDQSAMLARELSRRKLALQMQTFPSASTSVGSVEANTYAVKAGIPQGTSASPVPQPVTGVSHEGFLPPHRPQQQPSPTINPWSERAGASSAQPSWSPPQIDRTVYTNGNYVGVSRPTSVDRTTLRNEESVFRPPSRSFALPSGGAGASPYMSEIGLSSLRGSEGGSQLQGNPRWSGQWPPSIPRNSY